MKNLYVILASQDFESANHRGLWEELSSIEDNEVLVMNIPADLIVTPIKGKLNRFKDNKKGAVYFNQNLKVIRPLFIIRPEFSINFMNKIICKKIWKIIENEYHLGEFKNIRFIYYNPFWTKILNESSKKIQTGYYLFDEVRFNANNNTINKQRSKEDEFACKNADLIFLMSEKLIETRKIYKEKMILVGNGSSMKKTSDIKKLDKSIGFVGNFRNWIDEKLLINLIELKKDYNFYFVGPIEKDMQEFFNNLLNKYPNVFYGGVKNKKQIAQSYQLFQVIIIPYKNSDFIKATRPIKIVEAISMGTPVVSVPVKGYEESKFIKFSTNHFQFSESIDHLCLSGIDTTSIEYKNFISKNTWKNKANTINKSFEDL